MGKLRSFLPALALGVVAAVSGASSASAGPISYIETTAVSGTLGGNSFNGMVTLEMLNVDTINIMNPTSDNPSIPGPATVTVVESNGITVTATFTDPIAVFSNLPPNVTTPLVGFRDTNFSPSQPTLDIIDDISSSFAIYRLASPVGPVSGMAGASPGEPFPTDKGNFFLNEIPPTATFTAITQTATPEPSSLAVLAAALAGLGLARGRRRS